ncbi:MAG: DUF2207 domain-containing protein, partial [Mycobacterium sp.]|nr:DUF2207 domain-containing protein [Mycobacterium sp.]
MRGIGRKVALLIPALLTVLGLLWPAIFTGTSQSGPVADPVRFSSLRAEFTVGADGLMHATETITAVFPSGRHGIFRYWDIANANDSHVRQEPEVTEISLDGESVPYDMLWKDDRFRVAKIGDPDSYVMPGTHIYRIRYSVPGVLDAGTKGAAKQFASKTGDADAQSVFFWNVIAPAWNNEIDRAEVSITLPGPVPGVQCSVGGGVGRGCDGLTVTGNTVTLSAENLAPHTPVTVRAGVEVPTPPRAELPWSARWDGVLGRSLSVALWLVGLTATAGLGAVLWWRSTVEPSPGFPLQYAPPKGLGPVQCEYIRTERVSEQGLTATLFYLADRNLLSLRQDGPKKWTVNSVGEAGGWADVDPVSVAVGSALDLTYPGRVFRANGSVTSGRKLITAKADMETAVKQWARDQGFVAKHSVDLWLRFANVLALGLAIAGFLRWWLFPITLWGLPFAVFFLLTLPAWRPGVGLRRTPAGRQLWSEAGGFHRMLATDSAESRFDFSARKDLYAAYVPFAVAGGAAAAWAAKYQAATGQPAPDPGWYHSSSGSGSSGSWSGGASFDSFDSALSSSIGAYTASQSSPSSGGGGGGGGAVPYTHLRA